MTPQSFTNGLYFKGFRSYLLSHSALDYIHIVKHRDKVFNNSDSVVSQENITVCSSDCDGSISHAVQKQYPYALIIDLSNDQRMIRIPESVYDATILRQAENLPTTFESAGYYIAMGQVVEHRARQYFTKETRTSNSIPLYRSHNVTPLTTTWTGTHKKEVSFLLNKEHEKHTLENGDFVLLKRFSSKMKSADWLRVFILKVPITVN